MKMRPEQIPLNLKADPIDADIDAKCESGYRCSHCGFGKVRVRETLCGLCIRKFIRGLAYMSERRKT